MLRRVSLPAGFGASDGSDPDLVLQPLGCGQGICFLWLLGQLCCPSERLLLPGLKGRGPLRVLTSPQAKLKAASHCEGSRLMRENFKLVAFEDIGRWVQMPRFC